jgi:hypothetical protein
MKSKTQLSVVVIHPLLLVTFSVVACTPVFSFVGPCVSVPVIFISRFRALFRGLLYIQLYIVSLKIVDL